jgi:hypothetical protein
MIGIALSEKQIERQVPKVALSLEEVYWSFGQSKSLVEALREIGALRGKRHGARVLFGSVDVHRVWAEYLEGKYDGQLDRVRKG